LMQNHMNKNVSLPWQAERDLLDSLRFKRRLHIIKQAFEAARYYKTPEQLVLGLGNASAKRRNKPVTLPTLKFMEDKFE